MNIVLLSLYRCILPVLPRMRALGVLSLALIAAIFTLLCQFAQAGLPHSCTEDIQKKLKTCSKSSRDGKSKDSAYYYVFHSPVVTEELKQQGVLSKGNSLLKIGLSTHLNFFKHRYAGDIRHLIGMCMLNPDMPEAPKQKPYMHYSDTLIKVPDSTGQEVVKKCVRQHMRFVAAIKCEASPVCMDRRFVCAIERLEKNSIDKSKNNNKKTNNNNINIVKTVINPKKRAITRRPFSRIAFGEITFDATYMLGRASWLHSGHTEWFKYRNSLDKLNLDLARIFTDPALGDDTLKCSRVNAHNGLTWKKEPRTDPVKLWKENRKRDKSKGVKRKLSQTDDRKTKKKRRLLKKGNQFIETTSEIEGDVAEEAARQEESVDALLDLAAEETTETEDDTFAYLY